MKLIKNILTGIWMYFHLISISKLYRQTKKYRSEEKYDLEREAIRKMQHKWGSDMINKCGINLHIEGLENVPEEACLFVANHQSYVDLAAFTAAIDRQIGFIAKRSLTKLPFFGKFIYAVRSVFIDHEDARGAVKVIETGIEHLKLGFSMGIFPEGKRMKGPVMGEFKKGSLKLATKPGVKVVPVTISGTYKAFEENGCFKPCDVDIYIHPPIETKGIEKQEANNMAETVETIVKTKLLELQGKR